VNQLIGFQIYAFGGVDRKRTTTFFPIIARQPGSETGNWAQVSKESDNEEDGIDF
jgi:hypothetical protein